MSGWNLARGVGNPRPTYDPADVGATEMFTPGAITLFPFGVLVFISDADGSNPEFLGTSRLATHTDLGFTRPLKRARAPGSILWRAVYGLRGAFDAAQARGRVIASAVTERALDGSFYSVGVGPPTRRTTLSLSGMTAATESALVDWLIAGTDGGALPFTLVSPDGRMTAVRLAGDAWERTEKPGERRELKLELIVEAENEFR